MQCKQDATIFAVLIAFAVAGVEDVVNLFRVEGDEAEAMGDEFVGKDRGVGFDFDEVDCYGGDFSEDGAAEGISEGKVDVFKREVYVIVGSLARV